MLSDYRVLDFTDERGALCGQVLADLGADVLRIEPAGGSPLRRGVAWSIHARNCRSRGLDARTAELAREADVVLAHGDAVAGLRFGEQRARSPRLVWVSITPFGASGPKRDYAATDLIVQAAAGAMAITGFADAKPLRTGAITVWSHAGAAAAGATLLALRQRERTGRGQLVDVSAQLSANLTASFSLLTPFIGASRIRRASAAPGATFVWPAKDGFVSLTLAFLGPMLGFARNLLAWLREAGAIDDSLASLSWPAVDKSAFEKLIDAVGRFLLARTKAELLEEAVRRGVLIVPVATTHELLASPQFAARDFWWDVDGMRQPGAFAKFSARPLSLRSSAPPAADPHATFRPREAASAPANGGDALPLAGVKVLDFSWVMAGPWCTRVLADYGATVVKIESRARLDLVRVLGPFYGDKPSPETSAAFASINAGKLSFEVDPNTPEGKAKLLELVDWADVVIESFSPKAMKKWGLDYASLRARKPGLVMLSTCLFGQTGPLASLAGYGTMGAALAGLVLPTGIPGRPPSGPFGPYTDYVAPRYSLVALLAALHHRDRTGEGQHIDQSQAESAMHALAHALAESSLGAPAPDRLANGDPAMCPHDVYPCAGDDQWVAIAVRDDADWRALATELGRAEWRDLDLGARRAKQTEIDAALSAWTQAREAPAVEAQLQRAGVPSHAVLNAELSKADAQLAHRGHFVTTQHALLGTVTVESTGYRLENAVPVVGKVPSLGGDSEQARALKGPR